MRTQICRTRNLGEKIAFERREIEKIKREIEEANGLVSSPYISRFNKEFAAYTSVSDFDALYHEARQADIVYLGDYHALPACQAFHSEFLERLCRTRPKVVLALEMFYSRNQTALEAWMNGRISDDAFLRRIEYDLEWGYNWEAYRQILLTARKYDIPTFGIDCEKRNDYQNLRIRDKHAAQRIVSLSKAYPDHLPVVIIGESHLASKHLPALVDKQLCRIPPYKKSMIILQNQDELYWGLAGEGKEGEKVVRINGRTWCVFSAAPFLKYEAYRQATESWRAGRGDDEDLDLTSTIHSLIDTILNFIQVDKYSFRLTRKGACAEYLVDVFPEIYGPDDSGLFKSLLNMGNLSPSEKSHIRHHVESKGSCYIPSINAIYLGKLNIVHGAEEAAHFVHYACRKQVGVMANGSRQYRVDAFYRRVLEEALGYFGSKLIDPGRNQYKESLFLRDAPVCPKALKRLGLTPYSHAAIGQFIREHKQFERNYGKYKNVPETLKMGLRASGRKAAIMTHELGYLLGEELYRAYVTGHISRKEVARLFLQRFERHTDALRGYLTHATKLARRDLKLYP
ncbi:MAG: ChaN family lipoprotein [Acidobacteria bacterium]|nr:ChaN family lipoprotein [Acidobacteriota bacterium]